MKVHFIAVANTTVTINAAKYVKRVPLGVSDFQNSIKQIIWCMEDVAEVFVA